MEKYFSPEMIEKFKHILLNYDTYGYGRNWFVWFLNDLGVPEEITEKFCDDLGIKTYYDVSESDW